MREFIKTFGLYFAWLISLIAVFGSLYASEILGYKPCSFCWYQRIFLFPLAIILGIATYKKNKSIIKYIISLPIIGAFVALMQTVFSLTHVENPFCGLECQNGNVKVLGFLNLSIASFFSFVGIYAALDLTKKFDKKPKIKKTRKTKVHHTDKFRKIIKRTSFYFRSAISKVVSFFRKIYTMLISSFVIIFKNTNFFFKKKYRKTIKLFKKK